MVHWKWLQKNDDEAEIHRQAEPCATIDPVDLEIEKKWLQAARVDRSKFEFFYQKYYNLILCYSTGRLGDGDLAQDIPHEVFSLALDRLDKFQWQGYSFGAWLFQMARNLVNRELTRRVANKEESYKPDRHDVEAHAADSPDQANARAADQLLMAFCVEKLEPVRREIFQTYYWSGLKVHEIAVVMGLSEGTIKNHLSRGRMQLRRCLMENGLEKGLSEEKQQLVKKSSAQDEGWDLLVGEEYE